ncbi:membrane hypothetical protein [Paraburkholderia ribeironis]|uniref:Transmembrane protein n=1 Tax=Paraburkholderia ribeironis TaxID=1247936 RepID=A0A1N7RJM6_9BURK|nr:hypothetical protein [Paraburkholderia ribeironis]SIT35299.1 membrane hypothetical protein [Paraburkholderia ribeironis]
MLTVNSVFIVAMVVLLCVDPGGAMRGLLCVAGAIVIGVSGLLFMTALAVLPGVTVGSLAGYIAHDTARSWAVLALCVLASPVALWVLWLVSRELKPVAFVLASKHGLRAILAGGVVTVSMWALSPTWAIALGAAVPLIWALRKAGIYDEPLYKPEPLPGFREAE